MLIGSSILVVVISSCNNSTKPGDSTCIDKDARPGRTINIEICLK